MTFTRSAALAAVAALPLLASCATTGPVNVGCRAPDAQEMAIFRAIISHDRAALAANSAPGPARTALEANDPYVDGHVWGSRGYTGGTLLGILMAPPPCVIEPPAAAGSTTKTIYVYPQARYDHLQPPAIVPPETMWTPAGVRHQDYFQCRFTRTEEGWRLMDLCGLATVQQPVGS